MADAFSTTTTLANLVRPAVDRYVRAALRATPLFRYAADTRPVDVDKPGGSVLIFSTTDLAPAITPINEVVDPDYVALANPTSVTITINEYGLPSLVSARLKNFSFSNVEPYQRDVISYNIRDTMDVLVGSVLNGATNRRYAGAATSTATVDDTTNIASKDIRSVVGRLRTASAPGRYGELYLGFIHPLVAIDLKAESGAGGWREAHIYAAPDVIWPSVIGQYEGCAFVETSRVPTQSGSGGDTDYSTIIMGKTALAEAVSVEPHVEVGVAPDRLNRFMLLGWTGMLGWTLFRQSCIWVIEAGASDNADT